MIYQKTFPDLKKSHPREDFFLSRRNIFAIADGITRDPLGFKDFSGHDWNEMSKSYPIRAEQPWQLKSFVKVL